MVENIRRVLRKFGGYAKNPGSPAEGMKGAGAHAGRGTGNGRMHPDTDMLHVTV